MTVQAGIEVDTDIAALVGEMEDLACEHSQHGTRSSAHSGDLATHYIKADCGTCASGPVVYAACQTFATWVANDRPAWCSKCDTHGTATDFMTVIGPVK